MTDGQLLEDLAQAERENIHGRPCEACQVLTSVSEDVRNQLERAFGGTIGAQKLSEILTRNGYSVGRRAIANHRREGHQP